jgi:DNA-binding NarL/FixJ family response regulator
VAPSFPDSPTTDRDPRWDDDRVAGSILVVDDDAAVRGLVVRILQSWGYEVVGEAGTVAEALHRAATLRPETVLVDIGLPDGDGFTLTHELRTRFRVPRVVIFSSDADRANVAAAERAGAIAFLPKDELSGLALQRLLEGGTDGDG